MSVVIETTIGDITVDLYLKERPNTCLNFLKLCKIKYYNLCLFYKIEKNFIAQTGDPTATGRGGESIFCHLYGDQAKYFDAEFKPRLKHEKLGTLSMVNNGNNMNGSQFFLTLSENLTYLDENHTVFGEVAEGFDVLLKLNDAICDNNNRPYQDIRITHTVVLHDPFEDPKDLTIPDASPEPTKEMLESNYIGADEEIDENKGKTTEEVEEKIKESEAKARATILEMVGDIPDAEVKPPENVLFVCKLNPVTTSEDLEIIFSRFGKILSCEVIKDKKTGESLQYAFIEFEKEEDCEAAYFKMDNVLIDDRRIHVDFSQSVSKMNFDNDKLGSSKPLKSNISLKKADRIDGYDLIFDMENDISVEDKSRKAKSRESAHKYETSSKKHKQHSHSKEREHRKTGELSSYERRYRDSKNDKYLSDNDKSSRYQKHEYSYSTEISRDSDQYSKSKNRYSSQSTSRSYRDSEYYRKSPESHSKQHRSLGRKSRYDSVSPDSNQKSYNRYREQSPYNSHSSKSKYSDKSDRHEYYTKDIRIKSSKDSKRVRIETSAYKLKRDSPRKVHSSKRSKVSSSSSSSSSTSSDSDSSTSSSSSSEYTHKEKSHRQKQEVLNSRNKLKSQRKRKYST